jgi:hypothetical protein
MSPATRVTLADDFRWKSSWRGRMKKALGFLALVISLAALPLPVAQAQTSPDDLISNNGFENSATPLGFEPFSAGDGSVAHTTVNPIAGTGSLAITVNGYGRIGAWHQYGYGSGPFARSVTLSAKLRVDSSTVPGRELTACAIAYFLDSSEPASLCRSFPVDAAHVVDVHLALDTNSRQLNYLFPQFALNDSGTIQGTVDDVHYFVDEAQLPFVPAGFKLTDLITNNGFDNPATELGFEPVSENDGSVAHTTLNPILGTGSLKIALNGYGRISSWHQYGWGSGPFARSVTFAAKLRVDSADQPGRTLNACAIAYFLDSQEPSLVCQDFPVAPNKVVDVYLSLPTNDRRLNYLFPQFKLDDGGTIEATVDAVHYWVVEPDSSTSCSEDSWSCGDWSSCAADGTQTRTCTMTFDCPNTVTPSPATTQSCTPPQECTQDTWQCGDWSFCASDGTQTRSCTKTFDCPNADTPSPATAQSCTPVPNGPGPTNPSRQGGRYVAMMSPTNGETFWAPASSLRLVAQGFDPNVFTNEPTQGHGQNASQVEFFVDGASVLTVSGANAEYSVFKGYVTNVVLSPGAHNVWARATYVNPSLVLDSPAQIITVQNPPSYAQTIELTQDVVLSSTNPSYQVEGTPAARFRLNGNGYSIHGTGNLTLRNVDVSDLGSRTDGLASGISVASSGSVIVEGSTFDSSNRVSLQLNGTAAASIRGNTFRSNSRIPIGQSPFEPDTAHIVDLSGSSTGAKTFAGTTSPPARSGWPMPITGCWAAPRTPTATS